MDPAARRAKSARFKLSEEELFNIYETFLFVLEYPINCDNNRLSKKSKWKKL